MNHTINRTAWTILFLGIIAVAGLFYGSFARSAQAAAPASFSIYPSHGSISVGSVISAGVFISSPDAINTASSIIAFPADKFEVVSFETGDSVFDFWIEQPTVSAEGGIIKFSGAIFNPGFAGSLGRVLTIRLKAKAPGSADIRFTSGLMLANDGRGTQVQLAPFAPATFTIHAPGEVNVPENIAAGGADSLTTDVSVDRVIKNQMFFAGILILLVILIIAVSFYNIYRLKQLEAGVANNLDISPKDAEALKKLKKDLDEAEQIIEHRFHKKEDEK